MRKIWRNSELAFTLLWLWLYCMAQSGGAALSQTLGVRYAGTALPDLLLAASLLLWLRREGLWTRYGLCPTRVPAEKLLWFLPLVLLSTCNLWGGTEQTLTPLECALCVVTVASAALLEEVLIRGFLFRCLEKRGTGWAVAISTLVFGGAHLLNFGALGWTATLIQVVGALAFGLLSAVLLLLRWLVCRVL